MLRIQLDINGRSIGTVGVLNTEETRVETGDDDVSWIEVKYKVFDLRGHEMHGGEIYDYPEICEVWHDRADGAAALTARVMEEVEEEKHLDTR